eukprot:TRINITY_DN10340_c0_g2_i11.p2 TRINITY_DN10340_c0_g2~~TRINITY_DN10340_c0_g2_i11.p2  ORF type:complete len:251 (-),score=47.76 TRINITY_DN10340_c0_g2_i11:849-1601(-)
MCIRDSPEFRGEAVHKGELNINQMSYENKAYILLKDSRPKTSLGQISIKKSPRSRASVYDIQVVKQNFSCKESAKNTEMKRRKRPQQKSVAEPSKTFDSRTSVNINSKAEQIASELPNTGRVDNPNSKFPGESPETDSFQRVFDFINNYGEKVSTTKNMGLNKGEKKRKEAGSAQIFVTRPVSQVGFRPDKRPEPKPTIKINSGKIQNKRSKSSCSNSIQISGALAENASKAYGAKPAQKRNVAVTNSSG